MPRTCGLCSHFRRADLERRLLDGESMRLVAVDARLSESAVSRHVRNHLSPELRAQLRSGTAGLHLGDFGDRLMALVEATEAVREQAHTAGDPRLLLQAVASERDTLGVLMTKLGIDSEELADYVGEARNLVDAIRAVLVKYPDVSEEMADSLRDTQPDLADAFVHLTKRGRGQLPRAREEIGA